MLQYRPYIIRMNAMARSMISIQSDLTDVAREILESAIHEIESLENIESPAFHFERIRSTNYLKSALEQLEEGDDHPSDDLRQELEQAVEEEDYERAAELRDQLRNMS